ncbi:MAG: urate hydroxylase PuuD [Candidatus Puniceispirillales bacterium]
MASFLNDLRLTISLSLILSTLFISLIIYLGDFQGIIIFWIWFLRLLHVIAGIIWVGLLFYFNFIQIPNMLKIPDNQKSAISNIIAPSALFWFRWSAMATIIFGIMLAYFQGYIVEAFTLSETHWVIGIGMYLGIIMFLNVWLIIWPNQKKVLGIIKVEENEKKLSSKRAFNFSRLNLVLSIPMLISMTVHQNLFA